MFNIQKHLRHAILAVGLAAASLTASANVLPTYRIGVPDTTTADIAFIYFVFSSITGAAPATATLSNFTGKSLAEGEINGVVSATSNGFSFGNASGLNDLYIGVNGPFTFDLNFSEGFLGVNTTFARNSNFAIALYDSSETFIGETESALNFTLSKNGVARAQDSSLLSLELIPASVAAVPEPADWALMLTGLGLVVYMTRRSGRANARRLAAA